MLEESYYKPTFQKSKKRFHESVLEYLKFLRKDNAGFYRARIVKTISRDIYSKHFNFYKLNGFIKSDPFISYEDDDIAHWFVSEGINFKTDKKIKFKIGERCREFEILNEKVIKFDEWYIENYR